MRKVLIMSLAVAGATALGGGLWLGATSGRTSAGSKIGPAYGVLLDLPSGWIGHIYDGNNRTPTPYGFLQATSFTGAGPDVLRLEDDAAIRVGEAMGASDILILLWETGGGAGETYEPLGGAGPEVTSEEFDNPEGFDTAHRALARTFFTTQGRFFVLMVEFGTTSPDTAELARANNVLTTLRIEPRS